MEHNQSFFSQTSIRVLTILTFIAVIVALFSYARLALTESRYAYSGPTTISVRGEGQVFATPDIGTFTYNVNGAGDDAETAKNEATETTNSILEYLQESGIEEKDVKTVNYQLQPRYRYEERICPQNSYCPPGERVIDGFEVNQSVEVKVRDLEDTGSLLSGVAERGAQNISGLNFTIDDEETYKADARAQAIKDAKAKAAVLADELGVELVRIVSFYEEEPYYGGYGGAEFARTATMAMDEAAGSPQVPTGENEITRTINIVYEVR